MVPLPETAIAGVIRRTLLGQLTPPHPGSEHPQNTIQHRPRVAPESTPPQAGITEQTYYRWRKEYGGLKVDQAKRPKELEQESSKLKRLVVELSLDTQIFQDIPRRHF